MASVAVQRVLDKLPDAKKNGTGWKARCPAHDDRRPSLSISEGDDGRALVKCHAGCSQETVMEALELKRSDLMPPRTDGSRSSKPSTRSTPTRRTFNCSEKAITELERQHGSKSAFWMYHTLEGEPIGVIVRWNRPDGKDIRPVSRDMKTGRWFIGGMPQPRPLYGLPDVAQAERVYICEGEKAADAARAIGLTATTSPHGSKSAAKADWSPLAGKDVIILPDNDTAGQRYAQDVVGCLKALEPRPVVRIVELPGRPEGGDMADFVAIKNHDNEAIRSEIADLVNIAEPVDWTTTVARIAPSSELKRPLIEPFQPFPVDVLPELVASFVRAGAQAMGCDPSFIALPLLVGLASAIGNTRRLELKRGWTEPAILWGAIIGESGSFKSPALELALRAVRQRQGLKMKAYQDALAEHQRKELLYEVQLSAWKRNAAKTDGFAAEPPAPPEPPRCERSWTEVDIDPAAEQVISEIFTNLYELKAAHNPEGDPRPGLVWLDDKAKKIWTGFYNEHAREQADLTGDLAAARSKLEAYAARLALVHHMVRVVAGLSSREDAVDRECMEAGITLSRWFANEARRGYAVLAESDEAGERRRLIALIERRGGAVRVRDWQRIRSHADAIAATAELEELVENGLGQWDMVPAGPKGGRPSKQFVLANHPPSGSVDQLDPVADASMPSDKTWGEL